MTVLSYADAKRRFVFNSKYADQQTQQLILKLIGMKMQCEKMLNYFYVFSSL